MKQSSNHYLNKRVLKLNVGFLLNSGPGHSHDSELDMPGILVADDVKLHFLKGPLRLSRTKEGVLLQAQLQTAVDAECYRCLDNTTHTINLNIQELFAYQSYASAVFHIYEDANLDMGPLLREEVLIEASHGTLCQANCLGLCPECGANLNHQACDCDRDYIDPRFAILKNLLDSK